MDIILSLSLILLLNSAGRFECTDVDDGTVQTPLSTLSTMEVASSGPSTEVPSTEGTMKKREASSGVSSSPDIEATKIPVPLAVDEKPNRTVEEEGHGRRPFIIDLGNLTSIRVRRSDSNEFADSMMADQGGPVKEEVNFSPMMDEDPMIQESAEDPENVREARKLESDEILEGVEQDRGRMLGGWYRRRSFAERRLQN